VIHPYLPYVLASALVGVGIYGIVARRNAVLLLIGVELILSGALILFVTAGATQPTRFSAGSVVPLFVITIAAAEVVVALSVILAVFRHQSRLDLDEPSEDAPDGEDPDLDAVDDEHAEVAS